MQNTMPLEFLQDAAQGELVRCKFSAKSIAGFTGEWRKFFAFAAKEGATEYAPDLAETYLLFRCNTGKYTASHEKAIRRCIKALDDFVVLGHIRHGNTRICAFPAGFEEAGEAYFKEHDVDLKQLKLAIDYFFNSQKFFQFHTSIDEVRQYLFRDQDTAPKA